MNIERCNELGILDEKTYIELENIYKKVFEEYLLSKVNLLNYYSLIKNSELGFGLLNHKVKLKSRLDEYLELNYFFVLNNFRIEKLSQLDIQILKSNNDIEKNNLIQRSYKEIIKDNYKNGLYVDKPYLINYLDSTSDYGYAFNNELVIAIYYGKNINKYGSKKAYLDNYKSKREFLDNISENIKEDIKRELGLSSKIIYEKI